LVSLAKTTVELRVRRYSLKTEKAYLGWIKRYIRFHNLAHPNRLQASHIEEFLSHLANSKKVSAATQSQALCALVFLYKQVLKYEELDLSYGFSKKPKNMPTTIS